MTTLKTSISLFFLAVRLKEADIDPRPDQCYMLPPSCYTD